MAEVGTPTLAMRVYYSPYHSWAARHFTRLARGIEDRHEGQPVFDIAHRGYVTGSILSAVAFLEAAVNEVFRDAADGNLSYIAPLGDRSIEMLASLWSGDKVRSLSHWPTLDKYQVVLLFSRKPVFDKGLAPYQDASLVIKLRNALTHFSPQTRATDTLDKMARSLRGKFDPNRLMAGSGNPFFPDHCLGNGCAEWAVGAVHKYADEFFARLELQPNYQRVDFGAP